VRKKILVIIFLYLFLFSFNAQAKTGASSTFDGSGDYLTWGTFIPVSGTSKRSICSWIKANDSSGFLTISSWGDADTGTAGSGYRFKINDSTDRLRTEVNSGNEVANTTDVSNGSTWYWVCSVLTGTNITDVVHYVNNTDDGTASSTARAINTSTTCDLMIGTQHTGACSPNGTTYYSGEMSNLLIFNEQITAVSMAELMFNPSAVPGGLVFFDPMWDGSNTHRDLSSNAKSGTVNGNVDGSASGPPVMFGGGLPL